MSESDSDNKRAYWRANLQLMLKLLTVWFVISYVFGILLVEQLNGIQLGGYKLGFWFSQQGAIYGFVAIIFVYARKMAALDRKFGLEE